MTGPAPIFHLLDWHDIIHAGDEPPLDGGKQFGIGRSTSLVHKTDDTAKL